MFIMLSGRPGSGKSYMAAKLEAAGFIILRADDVRAKNGYKNDNEADNKALFGFLKKEAVKLLEEGKDVVLDSTNTISEYRKWFLDGLPNGSYKMAFFIDTPLELCIGRNALRTKGRVPDWAYQKKYMTISEPSIEEGFDTIKIIRTEYEIEYLTKSAT